MKKHKLSVSDEVDFHGLAIISSAKDYRLCFQANNVLSINLDKSAIIRQFDPKNKQLSEFQGYIYNDKENGIRYYVVNNKEEGKYLIPKLKQVDFVFMLEGLGAEDKIQDCISSLGTIPQVQKVFPIDNEHLKNIVLE